MHEVLQIKKSEHLFLKKTLEKGVSWKKQKQRGLESSPSDVLVEILSHNRPRSRILNLRNFDKIFYMVSHNKLLHKIKKCRTEKEKLARRRSYLTNRCFEIETDDSFSQIFEAISDMP